MRIRLSEFKKIINKFLKETLEDMQNEDTDRVRRHNDGYGDDLEEDTDRLRRAKDGYGETEFEEAVTPPAHPNQSNEIGEIYADMISDLKAGTVDQETFMRFKNLLIRVQKLTPQMAKSIETQQGMNFRRSRSSSISSSIN